MLPADRQTAPRVERPESAARAQVLKESLATVIPLPPPKPRPVVPQPPEPNTEQVLADVRSKSRYGALRTFTFLMAAVGYIASGLIVLSGFVVAFGDTRAFMVEDPDGLAIEIVERRQ